MKRKVNILFIMCFLFAMCCILAATVFGADLQTSYWENRTLATFPETKAETLVSGEFWNELEEWLTDNTYLRSPMLRLDTWLQLKVFNKVVINDIVVGETLLPYHNFDVWNTSYLESYAQTLAASVSDFSDYVESCGAEFVFVAMPSQYNYFADRYPEYLNNWLWYLEPQRTTLMQAMSDAGIRHIDMYSVFDSNGHKDEYYTNTDHHFSYAGAVLTYETIIDYLNEELSLSLDKADVTLKSLPNRFIGSRLRELMGVWDGQDSLSIGVLDTPVEFTRFDYGHEVPAQVYSLPSNDTDDVTYAVYMGGDIAETVISTNREDLPNVLIFGDSYTNAIETLLYTSFNEMRAVDLRYYTEMTIREYIAEYQPDIVLYVREETSYYYTIGNGNLS